MEVILNAFSFPFNFYMKNRLPKFKFHKLQASAAARFYEDAERVI
jgi:hypothetical protein